MSLWDRLFKREAHNRGVEAQPGEETARVPYEDRLDLFWQPDPAGIYLHLSLRQAGVESDFLGSLAQLVRAQNPTMPPTPEARRAAVLAALHTFLRRSAENALLADKFGRNVTPIHHALMDAVTLARYLRAVELHHLCCDLLIEVNQAMVKARGDESARWLADLRDSLIAYFTSMPPDAIPNYWERLQAEEEISQKFWSVAARMQDRRAVPFLIESLPRLSPDGQSRVIAALRNIGDARAVPVLQAMAEDTASLLAPSAAQAVAHILGHSRDDAAQLLRATDSRHAGKAGETLLRAASSPGVGTAPDELLRAGQAPSEASAEHDVDSEKEP